MKICCISTAALPAPTRGYGSGYGGIENICFDTAVNLAKMGNHVMLLTTNESKELGQKDAVDESGTKKGSLNVVGCGPTTMMATGERQMYLGYHEWLEQNFANDGVIIDMSWWAYPYFSVTGAQIGDVSIKPHPNMKIMHSCQGMMNWVQNGQYARPAVPFPRILGISSHHAQYLSSCLKVPVRYVHNGIDLPAFEPKPSEGFLLSLNRFSREKGITSTVDVAIETGIPVKLVGDDTIIADQNYAFEIQDRCEKSKGLAEYVGSVDDTKKWDLIKRCKALIACPDSQWIEAFGLFAIEGFSQGKPIIALKNGGLIDTVQHGVNGFLCDTVAQVKDVLKSGAETWVEFPVENPDCWPGCHEGSYRKKTLKLEDLNPTKIRETAEKFSVENMARNYNDLCQKVQNGEVW